MKKAKITKPSIKKILFGYGFHIWFLLFIVNVVIFYAAEYRARGQTCFTTAQVSSDSRCLYILNNKVYEKGTRSAPHQGHPCGTNVTSVIPSFHTDSPATYLDPTYVGDICVAPSVAPSTPPIQTPTNDPTTQPTISSVVPSPNCLGASCVSVSPSSEVSPYPSTTISGFPNGNNGGGRRGGGGFFGFFFSLLQLILQFFLTLLGKR